MTPPLWTREEARQATGGAVHGRDWQATGVAIDSRTLTAGDLFVAIRGERHDGHDHVMAALEAGAVAALVDHVPPGLEDAPLLVGRDTLADLRALARAARARTRARVIGITGSVGKTSTKEMLRHTLSEQGPALATRGNLNNHIGLPLSLARLPADAAFAVLEMGMNHAGEIADLAALARPEVALITTVDAVHLENFDSVAGIAEAKAELFQAGPTVAVLNRDNAHFALLETRARAAGAERILSFGRAEGSDARLEHVTLSPEGSTVQATVLGAPLSYTLGPPGMHWVLNSLGVLLTVAAAGGDTAAAAAALAHVTAPAGRGGQHTIPTPDNGVARLLDDAYNASPASMEAAFATLACIPPTGNGRRLVALGDMLELGPESPALHAALAAPLAAHGIDGVFTCGPNMAALHQALPEARRHAHAEDAESLLPCVRAALRAGDVILVKGSHGSRMHVVADGLRPPKQDGSR